MSIVCKLYSVLLCPSFLFAHVYRRAWMQLPRSCEGEAAPSSVPSTLTLVGVAFCASMPCPPATSVPCHVLPFRSPLAARSYRALEASMSAGVASPGSASDASPTKGRRKAK